MLIAVLVTCHNRCIKTRACIESFLSAIDYHNNLKSEKISYEFFLTDDGCVDNTVNEVQKLLSNRGTLNVIKGDGSLFWAGGMRKAWSTALESSNRWDYYLLLNDDVVLKPNFLDEFSAARLFSINKYGKEGIISGITCSLSNPNEMTYGGSVWNNRLLATSRKLSPNGTFQLCDMTNANILFVHTSVVSSIGILYTGFRHANADLDYSIMARKAGFPVILTSHFCGACDNDHADIAIESKRIINMTLKERRAFFNNPRQSSKDYLLFVRRVSPLRAPIVWLGRLLNLYFPVLYYWMNNIRFV